MEITQKSEKQIRTEKFNSVIRTLKEEFVGLDEIIDKIADIVAPWYITPEVIDRPVIISLWGMTGTGKSSVIRQLIKLLDLSDISLFFDCAESREYHPSVAETVRQATRAGDDDTCLMNKLSRSVLVFDEFQHARTISDSGSEKESSNLRAIWSILDSGEVLLEPRHSWDSAVFENFVEDIKSFAFRLPDFVIEGGYIRDAGLTEMYVDSFAIRSYYIYNIDYRKWKEDAKFRNETLSKPFSIVPTEIANTIISYLKCFKEVNQELCDARDILEYTGDLKGLLEKLVPIVREARKPRIVNFKQSLIFIAGNLDEAFTLSNSMTPDTDADLFHEVTSRVTVADIKSALQTRFRPEQIARLGNNLIKYPSLTSANFEEIIKREVNKVKERYEKDIPNLKIDIHSDILHMLYSEGVYPAQGVRPLLTTVSTWVTSCLNRAVLEMGDSNEATNLSVSVDSNDFLSDSVNVMLRFEPSDKVVSFKHDLELGKLRNPKNRKKCHACCVHEAGHAVVYMYCTGKLPKQLVGIDTSRGGFCYTDTGNDEIMSRIDLDNDIMTGLGGYIAEDVIFGKKRPEMCLLGSGNDLRRTWEEFSGAALRLGYFEPESATTVEVEKNLLGVSKGFDAGKHKVRYFNGKKFGRKMTLDDAIEKRFRKYKKDVRKIIKSEKRLILELAVTLSKLGSMKGARAIGQITGLVNLYGKKLTTDYMSRRENEIGPEFFRREVLDGVVK